MDSDRILVLDYGVVKEFETPHALLTKQGGSLFKSLVDSWGQGSTNNNNSSNDN